MIGELVEVDPLKELEDRLTADAGDELIRIAVGKILIALRQTIDDVEILLLREEVEILYVLGDTLIDHYVGLVVDDLLELLGGDAEEIGDLIGDRAEEPDVHDRHLQLDVPHALTTHLLLRHLYLAAVADDTAIADPLILTTVALVVLDRTEDALTE